MSAISLEKKLIIIISIPQAVQKVESTGLPVDVLLSFHVFTVCDTVSFIYHIGKVGALNKLTKAVQSGDIDLSQILNITDTFDEVYNTYQGSQST